MDLNKDAENEEKTKSNENTSYKFIEEVEQLNRN